MFDSIGKWWKKNAPTRESLEEVRWLRPFAHRVLEPSLWRFTRRSVPRGVALGLIVGIFLMIPGLQIIGAAMLALPCRANVPIAVAMTFGGLSDGVVHVASLDLAEMDAARASSLRTAARGLILTDLVVSQPS